MRSTAAALHLYLFDEAANTHHASSYGPASDFPDIIPRGDAQRVEAAIEGFQHCLGLDAGADAAGGAMLDVWIDVPTVISSPSQ